MNSLFWHSLSHILPFHISIRYWAHSQSFLTSVMAYFQFYDFHLFLFYNISLFRFPIFSFIAREFIIACWSISMTIALNSCQIILSSDSSWCQYQLIVFIHSSCDLSWFLAWWMISLLYPGHFVHYVWRLWFLFKSFF
jgi:hypothetical protein